MSDVMEKSGTEAEQEDESHLMPSDVDTSDFIAGNENPSTEEPSIIVTEAAQNQEQPADEKDQDDNYDGVQA